MKVSPKGIGQEAGWKTIVVWLMVLFVVVYGVSMMLVLSPRSLYADPWRFAGRLLGTPWPGNVLVADNGHHEIVPNLLRWAELNWLAGEQWLQISFGAVLALLTFCIVACLVRGTGLPAGASATATLVWASGLFWPGNERALAHGNESAHVYLVTFLLVVGCVLLCRRETRVRDSVYAALCGILAMLSFGSGVAVFAAFFLLLLLRKARWIHWCILSCGLLSGLVLYVGLGPERAGVSISADLPRQLDLVLRWLASPFIYVAWPLLDPRIAAQLPGPVAPIAAAVADVYTRMFGPVMSSTWPLRLFGGAGVLCLILATLKSAGGKARPLSSIALATAWFALAIGVLVALGRSDYFVSYPDQLAATRYLPWSSLFWAGLSLWFVAYFGQKHSGALAALGMVGLLALAPSMVWMTMLAARTRAVADQVAAAAASGVVDTGIDLGENVPSEMIDALPILRRQRTSVFAWPETRLLNGESFPVKHVAIERAVVFPVRNEWGGGQAARVQFDSDASAARLVLSCGATPLGVAVRTREGHWVGWTSSVPVKPECLQGLEIADRGVPKTQGREL